MIFCFFFFKQKTAYEMRISDWISDVCSSDLCGTEQPLRAFRPAHAGKGAGTHAVAEPDIGNGNPFVRTFAPAKLETGAIPPVELHEIVNIGPEKEIGKASGGERECQYV